MKPIDKLIFALDVPTLTEARIFVKALRNHVGAFKIGLELFSSVGPRIFQDSIIREVPILLDLKLHDIPETVRRTALRFEDFAILGITVHAAGGQEMLEAAVSTDIPVYAVTVLTSIGQKDLYREEIGISTQGLVFNRARIAKDAGCTGVIASPLEITVIRQDKSLDFLEIVTPGIRPMGSDKNDQKRTSTPRNAISAGADRIVVGRSIRDDEDPAAAADRIVAEIEQGLIDR